MPKSFEAAQGKEDCWGHQYGTLWILVTDGKKLYRAWACEKIPKGYWRVVKVSDAARWGKQYSTYKYDVYCDKCKGLKSEYWALDRVGNYPPTIHNIQPSQGY